MVPDWLCKWLRVSGIKSEVLLCQFLGIIKLQNVLTFFLLTFSLVTVAQSGLVSTYTEESDGRKIQVFSLQYDHPFEKSRLRNILVDACPANSVRFEFKNISMLAGTDWQAWLTANQAHIERDGFSVIPNAQYFLGYSFNSSTGLTLVSNEDQPWEAISDDLLNPSYPSEVDYSLQFQFNQQNLDRVDVSEFSVTLPRQEWVGRDRIAFEFGSGDARQSVIVTPFIRATIRDITFSRDCRPPNDKRLSCPSIEDDEAGVCRVALTVQRNDYLDGVQTDTDYIHSLQVFTHAFREAPSLHNVRSAGAVDILRNQTEILESAIHPENNATLSKINQNLNGAMIIESAEYINASNDLLHLTLSIPNPKSREIEVVVTKRRSDGFCNAAGESSAFAVDVCGQKTESTYTAFDALYSTVIGFSAVGILMTSVLLLILNEKLCKKSSRSVYRSIRS